MPHDTNGYAAEENDDNGWEHPLAKAWHRICNPAGSASKNLSVDAQQHFLWSVRVRACGLPWRSQLRMPSHWSSIKEAAEPRRDGKSTSSERNRRAQPTHGS